MRHLSLHRALPFTLFAVCAAAGIWFAGKPTTTSGTEGIFGATWMRPDRAENSRQRMAYEWSLLRNPRTGRIPVGIRNAELRYAATLPVRKQPGRGLLKGAVTPWTGRGPVNQGGRTRAIAFDRTNESIVLAGGVSGGMWRSVDGGVSWVRTTSLGDSVQSVTCVAQDPRVGHTAVWYYGTGEYSGNSAAGDAAYHGDGIYRSTDGGVTWSLLPSTASGTPQEFDRTFNYVWNIVVHPSTGHVLAAVFGEIFRSTDQGATWTSVLGAGAAWPTFTDVIVTSTGVLYATLSSDGTVKGIHRSTDAGTTWTDITPPGWPAEYRRVVLAQAPSNENVVYFLLESPGSGFEYVADDGSRSYTSFFKYVYLSGDGSGSGGQWQNRSANLPGYGKPVGDFYHQGSYDLDVAVFPTNENVVFVGGTNLFRSTTGFADTNHTSWIGGYATANDVSQYEHHHADQHALVFLPSNPSVVLSGHDGGISRTQDILAATVAWELRNTGYRTSQFYSVAFDMATPGDPTLIGGLQDNGNLFTASADGATPWKALPAGGDGTISAVADGRSAYYIGTQNGNIIKLILNGQGDYQAYAVVTPAGATGFLFVTPYVLDPSNTDRMYLAVDNTIWRNNGLSAIPLSSDPGSNPNAPTAVNWTALAATAVPGEKITAVEASRTPAGRVYYGTNGGRIFRLDNAAGGNPVPVEITSASFSAGAFVSCLAANPRNADTAVAVFSNYGVKSLFLTTNGGTSWTDISGNLEQNPDGSGAGPSCRWATVLPEPGGVRLYVATSTGVYSSAAINGAATVWQQEGIDRIGRVVVTMVRSRPSDRLVVAATHANGMYSTIATTTGIGDDKTDVPTAIQLHTNYPNPFNPSTTIRFELPAAGQVKLEVYDALGRKVATLVDESKAAGFHTATFDGLHLPSGTYLARLSTGGQVRTVKMQMVK